MVTLIRVILLAVLVLLAARLLNRIFPARKSGCGSEDDSPIIEGEFTDVTDEDEEEKEDESAKNPPADD